MKKLIVILLFFLSSPAWSATVETDSVELIATPEGDAVNGALVETITITPCQSIVISPVMGNQRKWAGFRSWAGGRSWAGQPGLEWKCNKQALMDSN